MDARLKTPEDPRPLTREECIVETVLGIIGGATVIEDGIERQIDPHDIRGVLYHLREACLTTQRFRARQSKQAMRAIKQLSAALQIGASSSRACCTLPWSRQRRARLMVARSSQDLACC